MFYQNISAAEAAAAITHRSVRAAQNNPAGAARHGAQTLRSKRRNKSKLEQSSPENEVYFFSFLSHQGSLLFFFGFYKKKEARVGSQVYPFTAAFPPVVPPSNCASQSRCITSLAVVDVREAEREAEGGLNPPIGCHSHKSPARARRRGGNKKKREGRERRKKNKRETRPTKTKRWKKKQRCRVRRGFMFKFNNISVFFVHVHICIIPD